MSMTAVLERPAVVEFEAAVKNGIIEVPVQYRNAFLEPVLVEIRIIDEKKMAREQLRRAFDYGNSLGKKLGITEEMINEEIEAYRKEKSVK
ncbi:MAG: hypothetical protein FWH22_04930 [Fibromonadales bacterium]|nr:hypothetical protein [Fibromonadales bacterium]